MTTDKPCRCGPEGCADSACPGRSDYQRLMDKHNALHLNAHDVRIERDRLAAEVERLRDELCLCCELKRGYQEQIGELAERCGAAQDEVSRLRADAERYRWLCATLGETQLPTLIERITNGYVADYKPSIDAAIDAAMTKG